ncbi:MAG: hypothetical protein GF347_03005 [Candidatus Moranbacteria bacterium]|nr:hypothetical protein [Candidatus Moranbacteria bacterium]
MANSCDVCNKTYNKAKYVNKLRGQYNRAKQTKIQKVNLQTKKIDGLKLRICTKCIKSMTKIKKTKPKTVKTPAAS